MRSATTGLAVWWGEHPEVPRTTIVEVTVDLLARGLGLAKANRPPRPSRRAAPALYTRRRCPSPKKRYPTRRHPRRLFRTSLRRADRSWADCCLRLGMRASSAPPTVRPLVVQSETRSATTTAAARTRKQAPRPAIGDERVRCDSLLDTHFVLRGMQVAQLGSSAVTIAEALLRSQSELLADRCCRRCLCRTGRSGPGVQCVGESRVGSVSYPGDVAVWADQHGGGDADHAEDR